MREKYCWLVTDKPSEQTETVRLLSFGLFDNILLLEQINRTDNRQYFLTNKIHRTEP
jgi:hypothetical protein